MDETFDLLKEMIDCESEKFEELLSEIRPQVEMIKAQLRMIHTELKECEYNYNLDFNSDVQDYLNNLMQEIL